MNVLARTVGAAWSTATKLVFVMLLVASLAVNVASFTVNSVSLVIGTVIEAVTGVQGVISSFRKQEVKLVEKTAEATVLRETAASDARALKAVAAEKAALQTEIRAAKKTTDRWIKQAVTNALALEEKRVALSVATAEVVQLKAARRVVYEGLDMPVQEAVTRATRKIKVRTVNLATADLSATAAQALPWIGVAVVVAATGFDLKMSCDTMKDMRDIEVAVNPGAADDPDVDRVCGLKVPTEDEIWAAIKASPGAVWQNAKEALNWLPAMPTMPEFGWPSLTEVEMPTVPDIDWQFWK